MNWLANAVLSPSETHRQSAIDRQQQLTKPPGSLGQMEVLAIQLASLQHTATPHIDNVAISIFAADHGIAAENVSAFPQAVTGEMVRNFADGGAAIAVIARQIKARLRVCNLGTVTELEAISGVESRRLGAGTANFSQQAAMTEQQLEAALATGREHADAAKAADCDLFIGGEMGIANTTSATALASALLRRPCSELTGAGTGINAATQQHKQRLIEQALTLHQLDRASHPNEPLYALRCVGGFEIAALTGAFIRCGQIGLPVLVDGFIVSVAALVALQLKPDLQPWLILSHQSAEAGHAAVIEALQLEPLLQLQMRLGEGSGAGCAVPLLQLSCSLHNDMATFASANISQAE